MISTILSSSSVSALFWNAGVLFAAGIGGLVLLIGLWKEEGREKDWFESVSDLRRQKSKSKCGRRLVIIGVGMEIIVAVWFAARDIGQARQVKKDIAATNPRNLPLASVTAYVAIEYRTNKVETNFWDRILLMKQTNDAPWMNLMISSSGNPISLTAGVGRHFPANVLSGFNGTFVYVRRFDWDETMREFEIELDGMTGRWHKKTNELRGDVADSINDFSIDGAPFLHKTEVTGGKVELFFNGTVKKTLAIPHQWLSAPVAMQIESAPNPFWQGQLGATNWQYLDFDGILQTTSLPPMSLKSFTITKSNSAFPSKTWNNVALPNP